MLVFFFWMVCFLGLVLGQQFFDQIVQGCEVGFVDKVFYDVVLFVQQVGGGCELDVVLVFGQFICVVECYFEGQLLGLGEIEYLGGWVVVYGYCNGVVVLIFVFVVGVDQ